MLNVNMGALNISQKLDESDDGSTGSGGGEDSYATQLLAQLASIYSSMNNNERMRVCKRVMFSGALPISRDTESYMAIMSVLDGKMLLVRVFATVTVIVCVYFIRTAQ